MAVIFIVTNFPPYFSKILNYWKKKKKKFYFIGVERGVSFLLKNKIKPEFISCDWDSVSDQQFFEIQRKFSLTRFFIFPKEKDYLDLEQTIFLTKKYFRKIDQLIVFVDKERLDMNISLLNFFYKFSSIRIEFWCEKTLLLFLKEKETKKLKTSYFPWKEKPYVSFFSFLKTTTFKLTGFKYSGLITLKPFNNFCISNEYEREGKINVIKNNCIAVISSQKNK